MPDNQQLDDNATGYSLYKEIGSRALSIFKFALPIYLVFHLLSNYGPTIIYEFSHTLSRLLVEKPRGDYPAITLDPLPPRTYREQIKTFGYSDRPIPQIPSRKELKTRLRRQGHTVIDHGGQYLIISGNMDDLFQPKFNPSYGLADMLDDPNNNPANPKEDAKGEVIVASVNNPGQCGTLDQKIKALSDRKVVGPTEFDE